MKKKSIKRLKINNCAFYYSSVYRGYTRLSKEMKKKEKNNKKPTNKKKNQKTKQNKKKQIKQ